MPVDYPTPVLLQRDAVQYPIPGAPSAQEFLERWVVNAAAYSVTALDTAHPDSGSFSGFVLVDEQPYRRTELHVYFARRYATIPGAVPDEPVIIGYTFPGRVGELLATGREPQSRRVVARVAREFFLDARPAPLGITGATGTASTDVIAKSGHAFLDGDRITFISGTGFDGLNPAQTYFARDVVAGVSFKLAATAGGAAEDFTVDGSDGVFLRGIPLIRGQVYYVTSSGAEFAYLDASLTTPTWTVYAGWIAARTQIVAETSDLVRWRGNIWERRTPYIIAQ